MKVVLFTVIVLFTSLVSPIAMTIDETIKGSGVQYQLMHCKDAFMLLLGEHKRVGEKCVVKSADSSFLLAKKCV